MQVKDGYQFHLRKGGNLLATGQTLVIPPKVGRFFVPMFARVIIASRTGDPGVGAIVRFGNNGSWDNVAALYTLPAGLIVGQFDLVPLEDMRIDIGTTGISFDVQTAATVATVLTADVVLGGLIL